MERSTMLLIGKPLVNHLFLWAIYIMAMLVITRGYIKSPRNIWMWCAKSKTGHWPSPVGLRYIKPCKTWFNKTRIVYTILGKISWLKLDGTYPNVVLLVVYVIFFNGRSNGCWFVYKGTTYIPKEIKPWWNIVQIRNLLDFLVQLLPARCLFFFVTLILVNVWLSWSTENQGVQPM